MTDRMPHAARREYSPRQRSVTLVLLAPVFLLLLPGLIIVLGAALDEWLHWSPMLSPPSTVILGGLLVLPSWLLGLWSVDRLFTAGRGTPLPLMATQELVVEPPYTYCRNPMALGAIGMYLGVAVLVGSPGAVVVVLLLTATLLAYIKRAEEPDMVARFGPAYLAYRRRTPFLLPRFRSRR
jgi:protein-S-isoprenylcysteine O-methyltransferase Ste14